MKVPIGIAIGSLMLLAIVSTRPDAVMAGGSRQSFDFTINTHERACGWDGDISGRWSMRGTASDSGAVSGFTGSPYHWIFLEGDLGTMLIRAAIDWETYTKTFEIMDGTGAYETWVGATGTWDFRGNPNGHRNCWDTSRRLDGLLP